MAEMLEVVAGLAVSECETCANTRPVDQSSVAAIAYAQGRRDAFRDIQKLEHHVQKHIERKYERTDAPKRGG